MAEITIELEPPGLEEMPPGLCEDTGSQCADYDPFVGRAEFWQIPSLPRISTLAIPPGAQSPVIQSIKLEPHKVAAASGKFVSHCKSLSSDLITPHFLQIITQHLNRQLQSLVPAASVEIYGGARNSLSAASGDIDCNLKIPEKFVRELEYKAVRALLKSPELALNRGFCVEEYAHFLQQAEISSVQQRDFAEQGKRAYLDENLLQRRDKLQKGAILSYFSTVFHKHEIVDVVTQARVPVLKLGLRFDDTKQKVISIEQLQQITTEKGLKSIFSPVPGIRVVRIDLCLNNELPVQNTELISQYMKCSPFVQDMVLILKNWIKQRELTIATDTNKLNSYSVILLIIFYLQQVDVLPKLQPGDKSGPFIQGFNCSFNFPTEEQRKNRTQYNLGQLIMGFFHFFGYVFPWEHGVVSIRKGRTLSRSEKQWYFHEGDFNQVLIPRDAEVTIGYVPDISCNEKEAILLLEKMSYDEYVLFDEPLPNLVNINSFICIEDPLEYNVNVTRNVDYKAFKIINCEFRRAFSVIRRDGQPVKWLLLSPTVDPPGTIPEEGLKKLLDKETEMKNVKVEFSIVEKPKLGFSLSLKTTKDQ